MKYTREIMEALYAGCDGNFTRMAKSINCSRSHLGRVCKRYGLENKPNPTRKEYIRPQTQEYIRTVQLLPIMNNSMISREVGLSSERIRQIRDEHGIPNPLPHKMCSPTWNEEKLAILCKLDVSKYTQKEISKKIGVSQPCIAKKCKEIGIDLSVCVNEGRRKGERLYPPAMLLKLYEKYDGNIYEIAKQYSGKTSKKDLNPVVVGFTRRYKKLGLTGKGKQFGDDEARKKGLIKRTKYTHEIIRPLWDKHNGNVSAIAREFNTSACSIISACVRLKIGRYA